MSEIRKILDKFEMDATTKDCLAETLMPIEETAVKAKEDVIKMKENFAKVGLDFDKATPEEVSKMKDIISGKYEAVQEIKKDSKFNQNVLGGVFLAYANGSGNIDLAKQRFESYMNNVEKSSKATEKAKAYNQEILKALNTSVFEDGGQKLNDETSTDFIEALRNATVREKLGIRRVGMKGLLRYGKMNQGATAGYVGETKKISKTQPKLGEIVLQEKKLGCWIPFSNEFRRNTTPGAMEDIITDARNAMVERSDLAFLEGTGTQYEPQGLAKLVNASTNVKATAGTSVDNIITDLGKLPKLVREGKISIVNGGYILHPNQYQALWDTRDAAGWVHRDDLRMGMINGFKVVASTAVPLVSGKSKLYFADFSKIIEGIGRTLELAQFAEASYVNEADETINLAEHDMSAIRILMAHDFAAKYDKAISIITDVAWGN